MKVLGLAVSLSVLFLPACQHASTHAEHKPTAPVKLTLETRALENDDYELTLTATTTSALDSLVLKTGDVVKEFAALENGATRSISARVHVDAGKGKEVLGTARTVKGPRQMSAVTAIWLGVKPPEQPTTVIPLPDGEQAEEVRE